MKQILLTQTGIYLLLLSFGLMLPATSFAVNTNPEKEKTEERNELSKHDKKTFKKEVKAFFKAMADTEVSTLLLVIIAILLPPLAMFLYDGLSSRFWISLLLTLLFYIPGLIYTLVIILGEK